MVKIINIVMHVVCFATVSKQRAICRIVELFCSGKHGALSKETQSVIINDMLHYHGPVFMQRILSIMN